MPDFLKSCEAGVIRFEVKRAPCLIGVNME